jgi:hypothetical protein
VQPDRHHIPNPEIRPKARHAVPGAGLSTSSVHGNEKKARATNGQRVMQQQPMMPFMLMPHRYNQTDGLPSATFGRANRDSRMMVNLKNRPKARALRAYACLHSHLHRPLHRQILLR